MKVLTFIGVAAVAAACVEVASAQDIRVWRGETTTELIDDKVDLGNVPAGLSFRFGVLHGVKAAPQSRSMQRIEVLDRVEWTKFAKRPQVIEVTASADAKPGVYECGMIRITVVDRTLPPPAQWKYYLDLWQHPWAVARMAKAEPFSPRHYEAMRPLWKMLAGAGQKTLTVTLLDKPWGHQCRDAYQSMISRTRCKNGTWRFDYGIFDEYVEFGRDCGIGPDIACYTMCPWGGCHYYQEGIGDVSVASNPELPEFQEYWGAFLDDFAKHLKAKGWYQNVLIAMDEREPKDVKAVADLVQKHAPGLRISMAGNRKPSDFKGITIDSYAQILFHDCLTPEFLAEAAERRAKGYITTHYVCCGPSHPNTFLTSGPGEAFWCGVFPAMAGLDGFLRWAYNSWPNNPMEDGTYGHWQAGDTYFVYPNGDPSWRFLELKNGIVAAEKILLLREKGLYKDELAALVKRFNVKEANEGKTDFFNLRKDVLALVNK